MLNKRWQAIQSHGLIQHFSKSWLTSPLLTSSSPAMTGKLDSSPDVLPPQTRPDKYSVSSKSTHIATGTCRMLDVTHPGLAVLDRRTAHCPTCRHEAKKPPQSRIKGHAPSITFLSTSFLHATANTLGHHFSRGQSIVLPAKRSNCVGENKILHRAQTVIFANVCPVATWSPTPTEISET